MKQMCEVSLKKGKMSQKCKKYLHMHCLKQEQKRTA